MKRRAELPSELNVGAWMNAPEHCVEPEASAEEATAQMRRAGIRHLLVMKNDELVGVVTDRDLNRTPGRVRDVMTESPVTVEPDTTTAQAARIMVENKFNCLPVMRRERVVGIITSTDLLAALVHEVDPEAVEARELEAS